MFICDVYFKSSAKFLFKAPLINIPSLSSVLNSGCSPWLIFPTSNLLSKFDVEKISQGEHPEFSTLDKLGMLIRGALNKNLAEDLKYTSQMNKKLVEHYHNYPQDPEGFENWKSKLDGYLKEAYAHFKEIKM